MGRSTRDTKTHPQEDQGDEGGVAGVDLARQSWKPQASSERAHHVLTSPTNKVIDGEGRDGGELSGREMRSREWDER